MRIPKRYGESKVDACPFCGKQATKSNSQGVTVCAAHKDAILNDLKCFCGDYIDVMKGKFGFYFRCMRCGNVNKNKIFEINEVKDVNEKTSKETQSSGSYAKSPFKKKIVQKNRYPQNNNFQEDKPHNCERKETVVRSDDPMYFD